MGMGQLKHSQEKENLVNFNHVSTMMCNGMQFYCTSWGLNNLLCRTRIGECGIDNLCAVGT